MRVVFDTSFLIKGIGRLAEPYVPEIRRMLPALKEHFAPLAPTLLAWEVSQIVHVKKAAYIPGGPEDRAEVVHRLMEDIELIGPDLEPMSRTGQIAEEHGLSSYDASYLVVAEGVEDTILLTADKRLARSAKKILGREQVAGPDDFIGRLSNALAL